MGEAKGSAPVAETPGQVDPNNKPEFDEFGYEKPNWGANLKEGGSQPVQDAWEDVVIESPADRAAEEASEAAWKKQPQIKPKKPKSKK